MTEEEIRARVYAMRDEIMEILSRNKDVASSFVGFFVMNNAEGIDITTMSTMEPEYTKYLPLKIGMGLPDTPTRSVKL